MPHYDAKARLASYLDGLKNQLSDADLLDVVRRIRMLLESKGFTRTYPTVSFYCNWHMHNEIYCNELGWNMLANVNTAIASTPDVNPTQKITDTLQLDLFRSELLTLFGAPNLKPFLFDEPGNWGIFVGALMRDLTTKPLLWPPDLSKKRRHGLYLAA